MTYRTTFTDPHYHRRPKTLFFCVRCQKDLKPGQPHRFIAYELDTQEAVHGEDWEIARTEITARRKHREPFVVSPVGVDCARRIGLEFTRESPDV